MSRSRIKGTLAESLVFMGLLAALPLSIGLAITAGAVAVPPIKVFQSILHFLVTGHPGNSTSEIILWYVRIPRVLLAALVGAGLAASGVVFQALFKNPMADPYIIGVSPGAGLGATLSILFSGSVAISFFTLPLMAFAGALVTAMAVYSLARIGKSVPIAALLLSGMAIGFILSALMSFLMVVGGKDVVAILFWLMGGFSARNWTHVAMLAPFLAIGLPITIIYSRDLNILLLGDERATQLGVDVEQLKKIMLLVSSMMAGAAVSVSGLIGFVGVMVPHAVRLIWGPDHRLLTPLSVLLGATLMVLADIVARLLLAPTELPVGIVTALLGGPFFLYLLWSRKKSLVSGRL